MTSRMEEFKAFVRNHPDIRKEVLSNEASWQSIYEDFVLLGENDERFRKYQTSSNPQENDRNRSSNIGSLFGVDKLTGLIKSDNVKNVLSYVKKINPDKVSKTLNTVQKVLQITQSFSGKSNVGLYNANYNSWWD